MADYRYLIANSSNFNPTLQVNKQHSVEELFVGLKEDILET